MMVLHTPVQLSGVDMTTVGTFVVYKDETIPFVLSYYPLAQAVACGVRPDPALHDTETFWQDWSAKCRPAGAWSDVVLRSMITLKALTYAPTGGMVAAPTTSLPEQLGGERNWDYRYCWLRDATLVLLGAMNAGYFDEAQAWREWLLRAVAGSPDQLQIMYGIAGERRLTEWTAPWLPGYENSAPVRIGNAAYSQLQLDVFGEIMDVHHQARRQGIVDERVRLVGATRLAGASARDLARARRGHLGSARRSPATSPIRRSWRGWRSIARSRARKVSDWTGRSTDWRKVRDEICDDVLAKGFDPELGTFRPGLRLQDFWTRASCCSRRSAFCRSRIRACEQTVAAIERRLLRDGFVIRYDTARRRRRSAARRGRVSGLQLLAGRCLCAAGPRWPTPSACSAALIAVRNDLGLLSEEYDPHLNRQVGNFPQAFSHMALVNTAYNLTRLEKPVEQRAQQQYEAPEKAAE